MVAAKVSKVECLRWLIKVHEERIRIYIYFLSKKKFSFAVVALILSDGQVRVVACGILRKTKGVNNRNLT